MLLNILISGRTSFKIAVFLFLFFPIAGVSAATDVTTNISSDTVWSKEAGPYVVMNTVAVTQGATLTVEPGTVIKFNEARTLNVEGALYVNGTETESVSITSIHDDSVGGDTNQNGTSTSVDRYVHRFGGITFASGSSGEMNHMNIRFAGYVTPTSPLGAAIYNQGATVTIQNSVIEDCGSLGIGQTTGSLVVANSQLKANQIGIAVKSGDISIENTLFKNSSNTGLMVGGTGNLVLKDNTFENNFIAGGFWLDGGRQFNLTNNAASGGEYNGFLLRGPVLGAVTLPKADGVSYYVSGIGGSPDGTGTLSFPNFSLLEVSPGASLTFAAGAVVKFENEVGIEVKGQLIAAGTSVEPVVFTAYTDSLEGSIRTGTPSIGSGGYIRAHLGSTVSLDYTKMQFGSGPYQSYQGSIVNDGGSINITNSSLTDNKQNALYHQLGTSVINDSFVGDVGRFGIYNATTVPLDATNNYWDDPTGPTHPSNLDGVGAYMSDNVTATPWLTSFDFNPPPPPPPPEPTGASSILFLPGIMGSRLYEESDGCDDEGIIEQERWFSTNECEQLRLKTDFTGQPLHSLYTKPSSDSVIDNIFFVSPLYDDFLQRLEQEKDNETIADYRAIPYDWRLKLGDILKTKVVDGRVVFDSLSTYQQSYLYTSLQELVSTSDSGKVTIVAHSNGGLVAKALLLEMQANNDPLLDNIDNLILVAVPQTGTPDAVVGLLQGIELTGGLVINEVVSRDIINTAPFGHHLLPSAGYFSGSGTTVQTPVLQFLPGGVSGIWQGEYGEGITSLDNLHRFLSKDSNRYNPDRADLSQPEVVDNFLLDYSKVVHAGQASFIPPPTMKVSQVAGIGISTPAMLTYFTDKECVNRSIFSFFTCTEYRDKLGYSVRMVADGDGTVVVPSALAMSENDKVERFWMDLERYNVQNSDRVHRNILEVPDIQNLILNTAEGTSTRSYTYLNDEEIQLETAARLVFQLHSPLDMWVSTNNGKVSSTTVEVSSALYRRVGEVQYIEIPSTEQEVELHMTGQATGSFTLEIERWEGDILEEQVDYVAVPTATSTVVTARVIDDITQTLLELDLEGDGEVEGEMAHDGVFTETAVSYTTLISAVDSLNLSQARKQALLTLIKSAEYYGTKIPMRRSYLVLEDLLLTTSQKLIRLYVKKRYISTNDAESILEMIEVLKNKQ